MHVHDRITKYHSNAHADVAEWQTQRTQNPPPSKACGFESHHRHQKDIAFRQGRAMSFFMSRNMIV